MQRDPSAQVPVLDAALLEHLQSRLRDFGMGDTRGWPKGLDDEAMSSLVEPHGLRLPEEARVWWRWHDGAPLPPTPTLQREIFPDRVMLPLWFVMETYAAEHPGMVQLHGLHQLISPVGGGINIYFDCGGPMDAPVPIYTEKDYDTPQRTLPSIGALVHGWLELLDAGAWTPRADGRLDWHFERVPPHLVEAGIY